MEKSKKNNFNPNDSPEYGGIYEIILNENSEYFRDFDFKKNSTIIVISDDHEVVEKVFPTDNKGNIKKISLWKNLEILYSDKKISLHGAKEEMWYDIFKKI